MINTQRVGFRFLPFVLLFVVTFAICFLALQFPRSWNLDIGQGGDQPFIGGFFAAETSNETTFRWSSPNSHITFYPTMDSPVDVQLRLYGQEQPRSGNHQLWLTIHDQTFSTFKVISGWRTYHIIISQSATAYTAWQGMVLHLKSATYCPGFGDSRVLGFPLDYVRIVPMMGTGAFPVNRLLFAFKVSWLVTLCGTILWRRQNKLVRASMGIVLIGIPLWIAIAPHSLAWLLHPWVMIAFTIIICVWRMTYGVWQSDADRGGEPTRKNRLDLKGPNRLGLYKAISMILMFSPHIFMLMLMIIAHIALLLPLAVSWRGTAAWVILAMPGCLLLWLIFANDHHISERLFLALCGGIMFPLSLLLLIQALPGVPSKWLTILISDGVSLICAWHIIKSHNHYMDCDDKGADKKPLPNNRNALLPFLCFCIIFTLGAFLRLSDLGTSEFEGDEARAMLMAVGMLYGQDDMVLLHKKGPVELLIPFGPMVMTGQVNEWSARLPLAIASLGVLGGIFLLACRMFGHIGDSASLSNGKGQVAGIIATAVLSVDGFLIAYARILQYQSIVVLMTTGALWCCWRFYEGIHQPRRYLTLAATMMAIGLLAHYDGIFGIPVLIWVVLAGGWRRHWRITAWVKTLAIPALIGGMLLLSFYLPFVLHENFRGTLSYIGQRTGQQSLSFFNNLPGYYTIATFYNTTFHMQFLAIILVASTTAWLYRYGRPRLIGYLFAGVLLIGNTLLIFAPSQFVLKSGENIAILTFAFPIAGLLLSPATPMPLRVSLLWFGVPFIAEAFLITDPRTHFYSMDTGAALLVGFALVQLWTMTNWNPRFRWLIRALLVSGGVGMLALSALYSFIVFVRQMPEYKRMFPIARPEIYRASYGDSLPDGGHYGHPHRDGWKVVGELYRRGMIQGDYYSNQIDRVSAWYVRGAFRCSQNPAHYFLGTWNSSGSDIFIPVGEIRQSYHKYGCVLIDNMNMMDLYSRELVAQQPQPFILADALNTFDKQPLRNFPIQHTLSQLTPMYRIQALWKDRLQLHGYDLDYQVVSAGQQATIILSWRVLQPLDDGLELVVELQNKDGTTTRATPLCQNNTPWYPNTIIYTAFTITADTQMKPGMYTVSVGLHDKHTWVSDANGHERVILTEIRVQR